MKLPGATRTRGAAEMRLGRPGQPDSPLAWLYCEKGRYDKSWEVVHEAQRSGRWIAPELLDRLKKASGKDR